MAQSPRLGLSGIVAALLDALTTATVLLLATLYRHHIATEDAQLQAYAQQLLSADAIAQIAQEMKQRRGLKSYGLPDEEMAR